MSAKPDSWYLVTNLKARLHGVRIRAQQSICLETTAEIVNPRPINTDFDIHTEFLFECKT